MYRQESHSLVNPKTCHAQDIYEGCDSRSSFRILIFSLDGRMVSFFWHSESGREKRPEAVVLCHVKEPLSHLAEMEHLDVFETRGLEDPIDPIELNLIHSTRLSWLLGPLLFPRYFLWFLSVPLNQLHT